MQANQPIEIPANTRWRPASVLAKKLADDIERAEALRAGEPDPQPYHLSPSLIPVADDPTQPEIDAPAPRIIAADVQYRDSRAAKAARLHGTETAAQAGPQTTIVGTVIAFKKEHYVVHISESFSDGDSNAVIPRGYVVDTQAEHLRRDLATMWMDARGLAQPGAHYILDALPDHYKSVRNPLNKRDRHIYVYGLPNGLRASSGNKFYPHFERMKLEGTTDDCECPVCLGEDRR